ncbi:MAG: YfgM family protein [Pseudomonadota bacterium]|jgi:predicted negative regulator of RcsB-dependent stress response
MAEHYSDQEQIEALRRWWKQYGAAIALALVLGVGSWFGWQQWQQARESRAQAAALVYEEMQAAIAGAPVEQLAADRLATATARAEQLKAEYGDTQYGALAGLMLARLAVAREDLEAAAAELQSVMADGADPDLALLARLRLVRVRTAQERYDEALQLAAVEVPAAIAAEFAEARGDIHRLRGDLDAAREAYQAAVDAARGTGMLAELLRIKLDQVQPAATPGDAS